MKVKMHDIKGGQLGYYRMSLTELKLEIERHEKALSDFERVLDLMSNDLSAKEIINISLKTKGILNKMVEVYNFRTENKDIHDIDLLELAINKSKEKSEYSKIHAKGKFKNKEEYEAFMKKCQCEHCKKEREGNGKNYIK